MRSRAGRDAGEGAGLGDGSGSDVEPLDEDEQDEVIAGLTAQHHRYSRFFRGFLTCMSVVLFLMITWELVTTEFDPAELITNSSLAMTMTRRRACSALLASAASYALAAASYMLVAPRVTAKLAVVVGLVPLGYLSYLCFVVTNVGFVRLMWLPTGAVIFGVLAVYVELERRDTEAALADLREARYHFKKA